MANQAEFIIGNRVEYIGGGYTPDDPYHVKATVIRVSGDDLYVSWDTTGSSRCPWTKGCFQLSTDKKCTKKCITGIIEMEEPKEELKPYMREVIY